MPLASLKVSLTLSLIFKNILMVKSISLREAWAGDADCRHCALRNSVLFANLQEADFETIHDPIDQFTLKSGTMLYQNGEQGAHMFTVRSGALKLVQYLPDGSQRIVRIVRTTDILGLEALVGDCYQHHAIALQPTEICRFPTRMVQELSQNNPKLHQELMHRWQRALTEADTWLTQFSTGSARQRMARLLLRLAQDQNSGACHLFSREDMGAMLGLTTETASRTIASFKREGLVIESTTNQCRLEIDQLRLIAEE